MSLITRAAIREHIFKIIFGSEFATGETIEKRSELYLDNLFDEDGDFCAMVGKRKGRLYYEFAAGVN